MCPTPTGVSIGAAITICSHPPENSPSRRTGAPFFLLAFDQAHPLPRHSKFACYVRLRASAFAQGPHDLLGGFTNRIVFHVPPPGCVYDLDARQPLPSGVAGLSCFSDYARLLRRCQPNVERITGKGRDALDYKPSHNRSTSAATSARDERWEHPCVVETICGAPPYILAANPSEVT